MTINDVDERIALLENMKEAEENPRLRAEIQSTLTWLRQYRQASLGQGPDTVEDVLACLDHALMHSTARGV